ncbi:MAG TPA: hypothetical protein VEA78_04675, partial [Acidimicrobiales bacterium]|nr:hypothetical protein [Acidimicrobiales bacterium]
MRSVPSLADDEVQLVVGPVDAAIAMKWLDHTRELLALVRERRSENPVDVDPSLTFVVDAILAQWAEVGANANTFFWRFPVQADVLMTVVEQWLEIRDLSDDELVRLGIDPKRDDMRPMTDAVIAAISVAL